MLGPDLKPQLYMGDRFRRHEPRNSWGGFSVLNGMAVVSEEDVWVVGEFYLSDTSESDSSGIGQLTYNAIHWDGEELDYGRRTN